MADYEDVKRAGLTDVTIHAVQFAAEVSRRAGKDVPREAELCEMVMALAREKESLRAELVHVIENNPIGNYALTGETRLESRRDASAAGGARC